MTETRVLALDLATVTGFALHKPDMQRPFFGAIRMPGKAEEYGRRLDTFERWLRDQFLMHRFTHIVWESQHIMTRRNPKTKQVEVVNPESVKLLMQLAGIAEKFAFQVGCLCYDVQLQEWRKHFIGRGAGFKRTPDGKKYLPGQDPKELAIRRCRQYGWFTDVADAAEACGILDYFLTMLPDHPRPWRDEALMKGAV